MNWFFWLLILIAAVIVWFVLSFAFKPIGKLGYRLYKDARDEIKDSKENEQKENTDKN